jgi:DNA mismatch repair protein MutL
LPPALGLSHSRQAGFARLDLAEARSRFRSDFFKTAAASGNDGSAPPRAGEDGNNPADGAEAAEKTTSPPDLAAEAPPAFAWNPGAEAEPASGGLGLGNSGQRRLLGQAGGRYILIDGPDGIVLVDPHALHERWNYDRLAETRRHGALAERLLLPLEMRLSPAEAAVAPEAAPLLAEHGFELECPEPARLKVSACPGFIPPDRLEGLLRRILADLGEAGPALQAARDRVLASLACRSSVLLGHHLPEEEMLELLDRFFNQGQLPTCPHGRPTAIRIGWDELARRFGR